MMRPAPVVLTTEQIQQLADYLIGSTRSMDEALQQLFGMEHDDVCIHIVRRIRRAGLPLRHLRLVVRTRRFVHPRIAVLHGMCQQRRRRS